MRSQNPPRPTTLADLGTPALLLDLGVLQRNLSAMSARMKKHGVALRPHLKTAKSIEIARRATEGHFGGITVSTLREAEYFVEQGIADVTYAVNIVPDKLATVARLQRRGARVNVLTDDVEVAKAIGAQADALAAHFRVFIKIDTGYHRAGVEPESDELLAIGRTLAAAHNVELRGVLTHAGHSYDTPGAEAIARVAEEERVGIVRAAERLRNAGLPCPVVSAGSTPTAVHARSLAGITEMRPGNYMFFDLQQVGLGVCSRDNIAVSVLAAVTGHKKSFNRAVIDAGALALSKDLGANETLPEVGYGLVCDSRSGQPLPGVRVASVSQEHGWLEMASREQAFPFAALPVGQRVRVLPNHSCLTAAMYGRYYVINGREEIVAEWPRVSGW